MQSALLFLVFSSVGVMFGWQPMPDGSPQYEYVVQLEPELVATMHAGTTIPISSEVPDDIRPIARIRILMGSGELPREKLASNAKPLPERESRDGLVEAQYVVPTSESTTGNRYRDQQILPPDSTGGQILPPDGAAGQILPPTSRPPTGGDAFARTLRRTAEEARTNSSDDILPPDSAIRPPQTPPRYSQTLDSANDQSGSQSDISRLFGPAPSGSQGNVQPVDERSILSGNRSDSPPSGGQPILPPPRTGSSTADDWRADETTALGSRYQRLDEPITAAPDRTLRPPGQTGTMSANAPGVFNAPWPPLERFADSPLAQEYDSRSPQNERAASQPVTSTDPAAWPRTDGSLSGSALDVADRSASPGARPSGETLSFPASSSDRDSDRLQSPPPTPEIRREMLNRPADEALVTASGEPVRPTPASPPQSAVQLPAATPQSTTISQPPPATAEAGAGTAKMFPLLLAWVLLSGSGAGNLYLFWSYLDIRHKYRGLIRTAGRRLGRRAQQLEDDEDDYEDDEYED